MQLTYFSQALIGALGTLLLIGRAGIFKKFMLYCSVTFTLLFLALMKV